MKRKFMSAHEKTELSEERTGPICIETDTRSCLLKANALASPEALRIKRHAG
jgi:hypothetical protein